MASVNKPPLLLLVIIWETLISSLIATPSATLAPSAASCAAIRAAIASSAAICAAASSGGRLDLQRSGETPGRSARGRLWTRGAPRSPAFLALLRRTIYQQPSRHGAGAHADAPDRGG